MAHNVANIARLLRRERADRFLDLGCDDGERTVEVARAASAHEVHGLEIVEERARLAEARGVDVRIGDLGDRFPYDSAGFDVVCSNQVIEHVRDTDNFVAETHRVLRPGGCAVVSTENLASWHNIGALVMGWQPFSLTNVSGTGLGVGNPVALHRDEEPRLESWQHVRVFAYRGLRELLEAHGFVVEAVAGAGYYPFPSWLARLDPRHAAFLAVRARRPA